MQEQRIYHKRSNAIIDTETLKQGIEDCYLFQKGQCLKCLNAYMLEKNFSPILYCKAISVINALQYSRESEVDATENLPCINNVYNVDNTGECDFFESIDE